MAIPTLVLRTIKGSALTYQEMDSNFQNLANLEVAGGSGTNYSNTNVAAYLTSQSITSYSNVQVASYLTTNPPAGTYSNVQVGAYLTTNPPAGTYSNVQVASYLTTNPPAGTYSNVQVANYLPTYGGNVANLRLGVSGGLTFSDGTRMTTAATGSGSSSNLFGVRTTFSSSSTMADPGNDTIRFNYSDPGTPSIYEITQIAFSDFYNQAVSNVWFESWNRSTNSIKGAIYIQAAEYDSPAVYHLSSITKFGTAPSSFFVANVNHAAGHPGATTNGVIKHVSFLAFGNTGTGTSGIASVSADTTPSLGGNLNVNNFSITGNVANKGIRFDFGTSSTAFWEFSAAQTGQTFYCGDNEIGNVEFTANVDAGASTGYNLLKLQNLSNGSNAETKMILQASPATNGRELGIFKPSGLTGYSYAGVPSAVSGDGGIYNIGGNLKLYASDDSVNPAYITFQGLTVNAASEPFKFNLGTGDLNTLGNINLAAGKGVYVNGVALSGGGSGIANVSVDTSPTLGGNLNVNNKTIVAGNAAIGITQRLGWGDAFLHFGNSAPIQAGFKAGDNSSSPSGITAYLGSNVFASNFNIVSNIANGPGANGGLGSPMGTGPLVVQNINSNNQAVTEVTILDNLGGPSGFFKPANANYDFSSILPAVKFGDAGFYNIGANITLCPLDFSGGFTAKGKVQIAGTGQSTPPFIFDIATGDIAMSLGNINLAAGKGVYVNGVALSSGSSYSNVQVATYLPTYSGNIANVRLGASGILTFADGTTQTTASAGGGSGIANVSVDTTPTLGGNLNPNGFSITANIAHTLADGNDPNLQRSKSVFRFENTDTRENLASAITIVGKGKNMRMGVLGNDPTLIGFGIPAGGNFIEGTAGTTSDLLFLNYGNINTGLGTTITSRGVELQIGKSLYINGVDVGGGAVVNYALNNTIHGNVSLESNSTLKQVRIFDQLFIANAFPSASGNIVLKNGSDETLGYDQHVLSLSGNINVTSTGTFQVRSAGKQAQVIIKTNGYNITFENDFFKLRNNIKNISSMEVAKLTFTFVANEAEIGFHALVDVDDYTANDPAKPGSTLGKVGGFSLGYLEMPQVTAGNVTLALADSGKHFYSTSSAPLTVTIPVNSSIAFPIGTEVTVVNRGTANLTIDKGSATLYLAGNTTSASRTITTYGVATLLKVESDIWMISGTGVV